MSKISEDNFHFYWLDLLRFLAALIVVLAHFRGAFFVEYSLLPINQQNPFVFVFYLLTRLGDEAVIVFFIMSGLLVGGKSLDRLRKGTFDFKSYSIDRCVRIMLPLIAALLFAIPVYTLNGTGINWLDWLGNLFSLQGILVAPVIEPLWSLSYEVWFYVLIGTICYFFGNNVSSTGKYLSFIILLVCALVFIKLKLIYLSIWLIGAIAYFIIPKTKNNYVIWISGICGIIIIGFLQLSSGSRTSMNFSINRDLLLLLYAFCFAIFVIFLIKIKPEKKWAIALNARSKPFADFSYTLYLTHVLVLRLLEYYGFPKSESINIKSLSFYILEIFIALIVSYGIYCLFEKRTDVVKKRIRNLLLN